MRACSRERNGIELSVLEQLLRQFVKTCSSDDHKTIHPAADSLCETSQGLLPVPPGEQCEQPLTSSVCGRTDPHRTRAVKESSLETKSGLLPETPGFLSMKSRVPRARSGARFNLKAGVAFH